MSIRLFPFLCLFLITLLYSCKDSETVNPTSDELKTTDYSELTNWAYITETPDKSVDIFYIHPTTFYDEINDTNLNWQIDPDCEASLIALGAFAGQASLFLDIANPYAPYYQQMNMNIAFSADNEKEFEIAYKDVRAAFLYYFENFSNGNPFFIMGHSQGAHLGLKLLEDLFTETKYMEKLIAAYIVGWPITSETLKEYPHLAVLSSPTETGGILVWDVVSENVSTLYSTYAQNSIMVNPLTWTITNDAIPAEYNLGAVFFAEQGDDYVPISLIPGFTGGQIKTMPAIPGYIETEYTAFVTPDLTDALIEGGEEMDEYALGGCYHVQAVNMFYSNIQQNAIDRKAAFLSQ